MTGDDLRATLMGQLADLVREYKERAKPIVDQIAQIDAMKPPTPQIVHQCRICGGVFTSVIPCQCTAR